MTVHIRADDDANIVEDSGTPSSDRAAGRRPAPAHPQGWGDASPTRTGPTGEAIGLSPRMIRYLEAQGVIEGERGPGPRGHRHFPPPEVALGRAAAASMEVGHPTATLRAIRALAQRQVSAVRAAADPLAWYQLLALAREVEIARRRDEPPAPDRRRGAAPPPPQGPAAEPRKPRSAAPEP
jgi:hypothetical protein